MRNCKPTAQFCLRSLNRIAYSDSHKFCLSLHCLKNMANSSYTITKHVLVPTFQMFSPAVKQTIHIASLIKNTHTCVHTPEHTLTYTFSFI